MSLGWIRGVLRDRGFLAALGFQLLVLLWVASANLWVARFGTPVRLKVVPVDPRHPFKGQYVRLGYEISVPSDLELREKIGTGVGRTVYVLLSRGKDGIWHPVRWSFDPIAPRRPTDVVAAGVSSGERIVYGIEEYYVQEGMGPRIERVIRKLIAEVRVSPSGRMVLQRLLVGNEPIEEYLAGE